VLAATVARAEPAPEQPQVTGTLDESARREQAKTLFERGVAFYREGHYKEALNYFLGAQSLYTNTTLTFNIARACERLGDTSCALKYYREYRRTAPSASDLGEIAHAIESLERDLFAKGLQQITLSSKPTGAKVIIDGAEKGTTPWTGELAPGSHRAVMQQAGFGDLRVSFTVEAAHAMDFAYQLPPAPTTAAAPLDSTPVASQPLPAAAPADHPPPPPHQPVPQHRSKVGTWTWVALGSGVAALGTAGILETLRASREQDVHDKATQLERVAAYDSMKDYQKAARIVFGAGLAISTVGLTLLTLDITHHSRGDGALAASCTGTFCGLDLKGAW
jgi:tetratricopeptide (TPR) repeat protein